MDDSTSRTAGYKVVSHDNDFHDLQISSDWTSEWALTTQVVQPPTANLHSQSTARCCWCCTGRKTGCGRSKQSRGHRALMTVSEPTPVIEHLRTNLRSLEIADQKLKSFAGLPVMTHAFFPGGNGLYEGIEAPRFPFRGTLILGSNFGCVDGFIDGQGQLRIQDERNKPTWKPLLRSLADAGIKPQECFFTNAWPFLHEGQSNLRAPIHNWLQNRALMTQCADFFKSTFIMMKPCLIVALGRGPAAFLAAIWPQELGLWKGYTLKHLDDLPMATVRLQEHTCVCTAITHPSRPINARHRRPPYQNNDGEVQLLRQARLKTERIED